MYFLDAKTIEIDRAVLSGGWTGTLSVTISQIWARFPAPLETMIVFRGRGDAGPVTALVPA